MVLVKDRRQANPAMEKLEKWGAASRPAGNLVIGSRRSLHWPSCTRRDRPNRFLGNSREIICVGILTKNEAVSSKDAKLLFLGTGGDE